MDRERRWNKRIPVEMNAAIYYGGLGLLQCKIRNISLDGVFVETGRIVLSQDTNLQIVFSTHDENHYRFNAKIARVEETGAGLAFDELELSGVRFLQNLINQNKTATN